MKKNKRFEVRADEEMLMKLDQICSRAAGIKSRAGAIAYAIDIAIKHLDVNNGEAISGHCQRAIAKNPELYN